MKNLIFQKPIEHRPEPTFEANDETAKKNSKIIIQPFIQAPISPKPHTLGHTPPRPIRDANILHA